MKKRVYQSLLLAVLLLPLLCSISRATVPDTAWTFTLPENEYVKDAFFSENDSILICYISGINNGDTSYFANFNSYTGELLKKVITNSNFGIPEFFDYSYKDTVILFYSRWGLYPDTNGIIDKKIKMYNYMTGEIIDSLVPSSKDPKLQWDKTEIREFIYSPDEEQLFMIVAVVNHYDPINNPVYDNYLYKWNKSDWSISKSFYYPEILEFESIAPNNRYYVERIDKQKEIFFAEINSDTTLYKLKNNDSTDYYGAMFPETDTTKFLLFIYDLTDHRNKIQVRSQTDFSIIKTIDNDAIYYNSLMFLKDSRYLIFYGTKDSIQYRLVVYDLNQESILYVYPYYSYIGNQGDGVTAISNHSELIFDGYSRTLRMLNAKYTTTSIEKPNEENPSLIYPNPSNGKIELKNDVGLFNQFKIIDSRGSIIDKRAITDNNGLIQYDTSNLSSGVYYLTLSNTKETRTYKFIVSK